MANMLNLKLKVWRQNSEKEKGHFEEYTTSVADDASFLEMLDYVNEDLIDKDKEPIAFDHDCREGICGTCGVMIDGQAHGPQKGTATCQLHMRQFKDGDEIVIEPWRAAGFPIVRDLVVNRAAFDRIIESGGYISVDTGQPQDANAIAIAKDAADAAMDAAACIGCGACVAACPNSAAQLFTAAKLQHLNMLPQGQPERYKRAEAMVEKMEEFFGSCTNHGECQEACPKEISIDFIAMMNRDYLKSKWVNRRRLGQKKVG
ncbi:MAG: succinate dehydrogenase/fumarate reductase iron-sulfur subunit [Microthrixaceae bacterium]